jgi:hypothetical protein
MMEFIMLNPDIRCINTSVSVYCTFTSVLFQMRLWTAFSKILHSGLCLVVILHATEHNTQWRGCVYLPLHLHFISWHRIWFNTWRSIQKVVKEIWFSLKLDQRHTLYYFMNYKQNKKKLQTSDLLFLSIIFSHHGAVKKAGWHWRCDGGKD